MSVFISECKYRAFLVVKKIYRPIFFVNRSLCLFCLTILPNFVSYFNVGIAMDEIVARLFTWYDSHCRELPWRSTRNPYYIWVSEVILQQTRVAQGYDYFVRFIERFPSVEALAEAPEDEVMRMWQGLGYYSRARNLHSAAKQVVAMGGFPESYEGIRSLRGVGDYTAAAIASFAFDIPKAAVDGNVCRVWSRVFGIDEPIDSARGKQMITELAQTLLPTAQVAKYNQAVMEFGALQCVPKNPDCAACPLAHKCIALAEGRVAQLPVKSHKTKVTPRYFSYLYIHSAEGLLLHKRTADDIWKNLYELPLIETSAPVDATQLFALPEFGPWRELMPHSTYKGEHGGVKHVLSHRILHASFHELEVQDTALSCPEGFVVVPFTELHRYALPRLVEQYLTSRLSADSPSF